MLVVETEEPLSKRIADAGRRAAALRELLLKCDQDLIQPSASDEEELEKERAFDAANALLRHANDELAELRERGGVFQVVWDGAKGSKQQLLCISEMGVIELVDEATGEAVHPRRFVDQLLRVVPGKDKSTVTVEWTQHLQSRPWTLRTPYSTNAAAMAASAASEHLASSKITSESNAMHASAAMSSKRGAGAGSAAAAAAAALAASAGDEGVHEVGGTVAGSTVGPLAHSSVASAEELEETLGVLLKRHNRRLHAGVGRLRELHALLLMPYTPSWPLHVRLLWRFRTAGLGDSDAAVIRAVPASATVRPQDAMHDGWERLGFQGADPATDFRGAGALGLHLLVYFAETRQTLLREIVSGAREYPFASACMGAAVYVMQQLFQVTSDNIHSAASSAHWHTSAMRFACISAHPSAVEELFCVFVALLDALFVRASASYMEFPRCLQQAKIIFENVLNKAPATVDELCAMCEYEALRQ